MRSPSVLRVALLAMVLATGCALAACGTTQDAAAPAASTRPGAQLRALNLESKLSWHTQFRAVYLYTTPSGAHSTRTERFTIAQDGSKSMLELGTRLSVDEGGDESYLCEGTSCSQDGFLPSVQPPALFYALRGLVDGATFWSTTQGYPITTADLASRGVNLSFSTAFYASQPSTCVTLTYRSGPDGYPLPGDTHRSQRWCLAHDGVVALWSSGRHRLVLVSFTRHTSATAFELPRRSRVTISK
jgi:hypothetical protein